MKVAFFMGHVGMYRHFEDVVWNLCKKGHQVTLIFTSTKAETSARAIDALLNETRLCMVEYRASSNRSRILKVTRELINYGNYFLPQHPSSRLAERVARNLPFYVRIIFSRRWAQRLLTKRKVRETLRWFEKTVHPDPAIIRWFKEHQPDIVLASPFIYSPSTEIEYVKAAKSLHIPTVVAIGSWDHLTTKGTFHAIPDLVMVWNKRLAIEAVSLHEIPQEKIVVTGAPTFDFWFEMQPSLDRASFCKQAGIDENKTYVVYLCSSTSIAGDETAFVREFAKSLRGCNVTRDLHMLVRPHPLNVSIWKGFVYENVTLWPPEGELPDIPEAKRNYYNMLHYSDAVIGVNTSAMLEAAILNKPCVTIISEQYRHTQAEIGHFRYLLEGDFLEVADSFQEAVSVLSRILKGDDSKIKNRKKFVQDFIRPHGLKIPSGEIAARVIELSALGKTATQIRDDMAFTGPISSEIKD